MNKTRYVRTSSGSMIPIYPHPVDNKSSSQTKPSSLKSSKKTENTKTSNRKG